MPAPDSGAEAAFLEALSAIDAAARFVARRRRCPTEEAEEFLALARAHLIADDYRVLRQHRGESSLRTSATEP